MGKCIRSGRPTICKLKGNIYLNFLGTNLHDLDWWYSWKLFWCQAKPTNIQWGPIKWCMTFVPIIRTSKPFWLFQCIWQHSRVTYPWCTTNCSYQNHCIWSQELWEHNILVLKNSLLFYRFMVEWVFLFHKMIIKGLITVINQSILTISQP